MLIVLENTDFLNEMTDYMWWSQSRIKPFWSRVSLQRLSRLYSLEGEVKQLSQKCPKCKGSFFLWGRLLDSVQMSWTALASTWACLLPPVRDWVGVSSVSSWKETRKRATRKHIFCLRAPSLPLTFHHRHLVTWMTNCRADKWPASPPAIAEWERTFCPQFQPHWPQPLFLKRKKQKPTEGKWLTSITKSSGKDLKLFSYSFNQLAHIYWASTKCQTWFSALGMV